MSGNRELQMDDYLAMLRRRLKVILIPALVAPLTGFLISYALPPKYSSQSTVLVEGQKVPDNYVLPVITSDFAQRVQTLSQEVLSPSRLRPVIHSLNLVKPEDEGKLIGNIQQNMQVAPVITTMSAAAASSPTAKTKKPSAGNEPLPGFTVNYTDSDPVRAQKVCNALTSLIVDENLKSRSEVAQSTTDFLTRQVDDAKHALDDQDAKLAAFKKQYMGQLPTDVDNNMRMLASLNSQLDASTQTLSRAQQDKAYTESMLAQQIASWKSSLSSTNPQTLEAQLTQLQGQLMQLQARYTDDYPDVIKTKADIAEVQKKLKEVNAAAASADTSDSSEKASASEPPEIRQLRLQVHQYQNVIAQATIDQKKLQSAITVYQSRTNMSPTVEEQYKLLTRDNDNAQAFYKDLLAKRSSAGLGTSMENQQEGEQMHIAATAGLPDSPSFPVRPLLAAGGFGVGLVLGALIAIILEFSDKSIRTERDAAAVMDLPLLISVPWLGEDDEEVAANGNGNGRRRFWGRDGSAPKDHEHVEV
ncbi:MAG TPA: Wzz/FepE/Etk N-terminal domain-containing protein [Terriglobales bacterium]|nr:Wzz/FepE/Etk N-terminal domain-containing protein [Terriglobales bacterium]